MASAQNDGTNNSSPLLSQDAPALDGRQHDLAAKAEYWTEDLQQVNEPDPNVPPYQEEMILRETYHWWDNLTMWWLEILASFLAVAAFFAIVGTLYPHQDLPAPDWPYGLSINTMIAIYIATMKVALITIISQGLGQLKWLWFTEPRCLSDIEVFDNASRGFFGAFRLVFIFRGTKMIASLGAIAVMLAAIADPFGQQIVQFYQCSSIDTTSNGTIPNSHYLNIGASGRATTITANIGDAMQAAIYSSVFENTRKQVSFNCTSGNCTFPDVYKSAAHCSRCVDVTGQLELGNSSQGYVTNLTLPSRNFTLNFEAGTVFAMQTYGGDERSVTFQAIFNLNSNGESKGFPSCRPNALWGCEGYGAIECNIYPCVLSQSGSINAGNLTETVLAAGGDWGMASSNTQLTTVDMGCLTTREKASLQNLGYTWDSSTAWLPFNLSGFYPQAFNLGLSDDAPSIRDQTLTNIRPDCVFQIENEAYESIGDFLATVFEGAGYAAISTGGGSPSPVIEQIYGLGKVTYISIAGTIDQLANAMNVFSRENGVGAGAQVVVICFPISILWRIRITLSRKIFLSGIFLLVGFTIAVTVVRGRYNHWR
ncbi:hypothetical protein GQ53DRAFT_822764 [Thozetella sp. PMI_491]|nr:hypothetical protein GQ53DRAFT_822764 [Thozetella sp. PMI_491]